MKTIGLLGGMSWESTELYYRWLNEGIRQRLGGLHAAKIVLVSVDFDPIEQLMRENSWGEIAHILTDSALQVQSGGAEMLLMCTNTMHKVAPSIEDKLAIPLLHIADATAQSVINDCYHTVGLLGTRFTMSEPFYKERLEDLHRLNVIVPSMMDQIEINRIIFEELCLGIIKESSRQTLLDVIKKLEDEGAHAIIEGCTEIVTLIDQSHTTVPLYDTTRLHVNAAINEALF